MLAISIGCGILGVLVGYAFARLDAVYVLLRKLHGGGNNELVMESRQPDFFAKQRAAHADATPRPGKIEIDTRTVVTEINTAGLNRASNAEMGKTTTETDSAINQSVSRLAQLKGK